MSTIFISDIHLSAKSPQRINQFIQFMRSETIQEAETIYILGDLFEYWLGDDTIDESVMPIINAIRQQVDQGKSIYFLFGNRDFLISTNFIEQTGCQLLADPARIDLYGTPVLISHGDLFCTDDHEYQAFRQQVRDFDWQQHFLSLPIEQRIEMAEKARQTSQSESAMKAEDIMDVNAATVQNYARENQTQIIIHGHTHRPFIHSFNIDENEGMRIVLGDWGDHESYLRVTENTMDLVDHRLSSAGQMIN
ncbi:MAG: UDP-2,3-diacylglucosamine diphosphatase [Gammaproteobacteria bacterium]|nr:UDP-2,3-diacylglucosamine diphosphatase [Gammaproteobacteria bacterium]MDH5729938.1 UDP-2,3-diacylglucosamine diphosphatase [Gammaproteobacteria bacterium]